MSVDRTSSAETNLNHNDTKDTTKEKNSSCLLYVVPFESLWFDAFVGLL
jgi:hypothetical protein